MFEISSWEVEFYFSSVAWLKDSHLIFRHTSRIETVPDSISITKNRILFWQLMKTKAICDLDNAPKQSPRSDCIITHAIQEQCHSSSYVFHERNHCDTSISTSTRNARQLVSSFCLSSANRVAKLWTLWVTASWRDLPREKHFQYMIWIVNLFLRRQRLEKCTVVSWGDFIFSWLIYVKRRKKKP